MYKRLLEYQIKQNFFKGKAIIIVGARQTGKTTLCLELLKDLNQKNNSKIFNCDNPTDREVLSNKDLEFLVNLIGDTRLILIDEGQKVESIGQTLKLLVDHYKNKKQILVTGSSSLNLLDKTQEPLTGRKFVYHLFPLSLEEIYPDRNLLKLIKELETSTIYGSYPEVVSQKSFEDKTNLLRELVSSYLYKDILEFQKIKSPNIIVNLVKALSLQIGSEVSYTELANLLKVDKKTVEHYVDILEKNYIIFRLSPFIRNKRKIISKLRKIYFYDLGIRNAVINNFNFLNERNDIGPLWKNLMIVERLKYQTYHKIYADNYFWRTYDGAEVDLVEERGGKLHGFEFKWNTRNRKAKPPLRWKEYPQTTYSIVTPKNLSGFVI